MPIQIQITDSELEGYSQKAKDEVKATTKEYIRALFREVRHFAEIRHPTSGEAPDVSIGIVSDAREAIKRSGLPGPGDKIGWKRKIIHFLAAALPFAIGLTWNASWAQEGFTRLFILLLAIAAVIFFMLSVSKE